MYKEILKIYDFANYLCMSLGKPVYVCIGDSGSSPELVIHGWAGKNIPESSKAPFMAFDKFGQLNWLGKDGLSPVKVLNDQGIGSPWLGCKRLTVQDQSFSAAVSHWKQEHDLLFASVLAYARFNKIQLHHAGFSFENYEEMINAENKMTTPGIEKNLDNCIRTYYLSHKYSPEYYIEHIFFHEQPETAFHWDFIVDNPEEFLTFIAEQYGKKPEWFKSTDENSPIGEFWVKAESDGSLMGVMARKKFWIVKE